MQMTHCFFYKTSCLCVYCRRVAVLGRGRFKHFIRKIFGKRTSLFNILYLIILCCRIIIICRYIYTVTLYKVTSLKIQFVTLVLLFMTVKSLFLLRMITNFMQLMYVSKYIEVFSN